MSAAKWLDDSEEDLRSRCETGRGV